MKVDGGALGPSHTASLAACTATLASSPAVLESRFAVPAYSIAAQSSSAAIRSCAASRSLRGNVDSSPMPVAADAPHTN